jgi:hypothetical protein
MNHSFMQDRDSHADSGSCPERAGEFEFGIMRRGD